MAIKPLQMEQEEHARAVRRAIIHGGTVARRMPPHNSIDLPSATRAEVKQFERFVDGLPVNSRLYFRLRVLMRTIMSAHHVEDYMLGSVYWKA